MEFAHKTALITGASRGIGRSIALELAQQGATRILLVARSEKCLRRVADEVEDLGVSAVPIVLDLTDSKAVDIAIAQAWRNYGPIDLLVNCAGVAYQAPFLEARRDQIQAELAVNLLGMYTITQPVARRMAVKRQGKIINVSSLMGKFATPTMSTYSASKFAIVGFTQALRQELAVHNVEVSALLPSLTDTDMSRQLYRFRGVVSHSPQQVAKTLSRHLNRQSAEVVVGWQGQALIWVQRWMPWCGTHLLQAMMPPVLRARLKGVNQLRPESSVA